MDGHQRMTERDTLTLANRGFAARLSSSRARLWVACGIAVCLVGELAFAVTPRVTVIPAHPELRRPPVQRTARPPRHAPLPPTPDHLLVGSGNQPPAKSSLHAERIVESPLAEKIRSLRPLARELQSPSSIRVAEESHETPQRSVVTTSRPTPRAKINIVAQQPPSVEQLQDSTGEPPIAVADATPPAVGNAGPNDIATSPRRTISPVVRPAPPVAIVPAPAEQEALEVEPIPSPSRMAGSAPSMAQPFAGQVTINTDSTSSLPPGKPAAEPASPSRTADANVESVPNEPVVVKSYPIRRPIAPPSKRQIAIQVKPEQAETFAAPSRPEASAAPIQQEPEQDPAIVKSYPIRRPTAPLSPREVTIHDTPQRPAQTMITPSSDAVASEVEPAPQTVEVSPTEQAPSTADAALVAENERPKRSNQNQTFAVPVRPVPQQERFANDVSRQSSAMPHAPTAASPPPAAADELAEVAQAPPEPAAASPTQPPRPSSTDANLARRKPRTVVRLPNVVATNAIPIHRPPHHEPPRLVNDREMQLVALEVAKRTRRAFAEANRMALYSARAEFIEALGVIAGAIDTRESTDRHRQALAAGLRALDESDDFVVNGAQLEADLNIAAMVKSHSTPVLQETASKGMSALIARQRYYDYAQQQLTVAAAGQPGASMALFGLGKIYATLGDQSRAHVVEPVPKALVFHQAALETYRGNHLAANEIGVLLARFGRYEEARRSFELSVAVHPEPSTWHNLAVIYEKTGNMAAAANARQAVANLSRGGRSATQSKHSVEWVSPEMFANTSGQEPVPRAKPNQVSKQSTEPQRADAGGSNRHSLTNVINWLAPKSEESK